MLTAVRPLALTITLACVKLTAQCSDPTAPASGFAITTTTNQLLTYTDGDEQRRVPQTSRSAATSSSPMTYAAKAPASR